MNTEFLNLTRRYIQLKTDIKELEAQIKAMKHDADILNETLVVEMEDMGLENFSLDNATVFIRPTIRASVPVTERDAFFVALRQRDMGHLIKETIPTQTLCAFVKEQIAENGGALPAWMDGFVSVYTGSEVATRARR